MELVREYLALNSGMIVPDRTQSCDIHCQRQFDKTIVERKVRMSEQRWKIGFLFSAMSVLLFNLVIVFFNLKGIKMQFPIGFIPLPFLIGTLFMKNKRSSHLFKLEREREDKEINALLSKARTRG